MPEAEINAKKPLKRMNTLLHTAVYIGVVIGYISAIFMSRELNWFNLGIFSLLNITWLLIFRNMDMQVGARLNRQCIVLMLLSWIVVSCLWLGIGFDWLLPTLSVGLIGALYPWRTTLMNTILQWLGCAIILFIHAGSFQVGDQITLIPAFIFSCGFSILIHHLESSRRQTEHLMKDLQLAHSQLQNYAGQVEELSTTRERHRIARDIHDTLGHYLTLLNVQLETATQLEARQDPALRTELREARRVAKECLVEVRHAVSALRPASWTMIALDQSLARLIEDFRIANKQVEIVLDIDLNENDWALSPEQRLTFFRCAQESLTNIRKHAQATKVLVRLSIENNQAELTILDNGGKSQNQEIEESSGFGIIGLRERVELLGGALRADAEPQGGWRVEVLLPLTQSEIEIYTEKASS